MPDEDKTREQLIAELYELRQQLAQSENESGRRKETSNPLRDSEAKYRRIVDTANEGIWSLDENFETSFVNARMVEILGYDESEMIGRSVEWFMFEEDLPDLRKKMSDRRAGVSDRYERRYRHKDGRTVWVMLSVTPLGNDEDGSFKGSFSMVTDITERKLMEERLRLSEDKYRSLVENISDCIWEIDPQERYTYLSPKFEDLTGYPPEEFLGKTAFELIPEEERHKFRAQVWSAINAHQPLSSLELRVRHRHGQMVTVEVNGIPLFTPEGEFRGMQGISRDITARKRAEEALRERDIQFKKLSFHVPGMIYQFMKRSHGSYCVPFTTEAIKDIFGCAPEDVREDLSPIKRAIFTDDLDRLIDSIESSAHHMTTWQCEYRVQLPGRPIRWLLGYSTPEQLPDGSIIWHGFITDITERKHVEEERRRLEERLQRAEKMEALGILAGGVAHDLNNVLGIVVGYSELLLDSLDESDSKKSKAMAILRGGQRAAAIVQDLLTLARRGIPSRTVLNLNGIVSECLSSPEFAQLSAQHPKVRIKTDFEASLLNMSGSSVHLGKSLLNLLSNAAEAMPNGGVITVRTANRYLDKPVSGYDEVREGDYAVLSVSDTGEGIPAANLRRIFEPFYTKRVMGRSGTGLGLAVVWGTLKDHFAYINVESEEGKGTSFTLYFPVTREELTPEKVAVSASEFMGNGQSILVVDDVKEQRELASAMLTKLNYRVSSASTGEEAVAYLKNKPVDLVVLDMIMDPGMDGLDTYTKICEIHPHQKAIIVSGFSETERVAKAQELGAGAYVRKPYVLESLGLAVQKEFRQGK